MNLIFNEIEHKYSDSETGIIYPSVTQVIGGALNNKPRFANNDAANKGTIVHKMLELLDKGILGEYDQRLEGYIKGWEQFKKDYKFECKLIEEPKVDELYGFAGTIDRIGTYGEHGKTALIDVKTGAHYSTYFLQSAGYEILSEETISARMCVMLNLLGGYKVIPHTDPNDKTIFLACLNVYKWRNKWNQ